ncbi:MAG: hypothetical protein H7X80_04945 [bacterium]|nr:hypothetical protein [Candidatus Kapabacteria bacterium]
MKSYFFCVPILAALILVGCGDNDGAKLKDGADSTNGTAIEASESSSDASPSKGPYKVKSGIVESVVDMMGEQHQTIYFDDFGAKQTMVTTMEIMGQKSETVQIHADGWTYSYDSQKKEGTKMKNPMGTAGAAMPDISALTDDMKKEMKFVELDKRTIMGKETQGMQIEAMGMPVKVWSWEGIPMRTEVEMGGKQPMVTEVKKIEVDVAVPAERFTVPADIKITEVGK